MATKKKNLLIVESPTKVKAIKKFLGSGYEVAASNGHVRDLPRSQMGIDVDNDFEPKYITIRGITDTLWVATASGGSLLRSAAALLLSRQAKAGLSSTTA